MRRGFGWGAAVLVVLLLVAVGIGAYNWGVSEGLEQSGAEVVRHVGGHGFGFFPLFLFFPLFFLAIFALKGLWWRRHWDHDHGSGEHGHGPYGPPGVEEWHRRLHERETGGGSAGSEP